MYVRPDLVKEKEQKTDNSMKRMATDAILALQFNYNRTAFDVNIDDLDEHPWRLPHTDISDYFNYGLNETTWQV